MQSPTMLPFRGLRAFTQEQAQIQLLVVLCVALAALAVGLPLWLLTAPQPFDTRAAEGVAKACERLIRRGQLAPLGFAAGGLLMLWGTTVLGTLVARFSRDIILFLRLERRVASHAEEYEVFAGGHAIMVRVVPDPARFAFSLGMFQPRIYITRGLLGILDAAELQAVVLHELAHVRRRDPLVCWLIRISTSSLWLPGASRFATRFVALSELKADEAAVNAVEDERALLGALLKTDPIANPVLTSALTSEGARLLNEVRHQSQQTPGLNAHLVAGITVVGCLAVLAAIGLGDWQSYWACAQDVTG